MSSNTGPWIADIPPPQSLIRCGSPLCSLYVTGRTVQDIAGQLAGSCFGNQFWKKLQLNPETIGQRVNQVLFDRIEPQGTIRKF